MNNTTDNNNIDTSFKEVADNDFLITNESLKTTVASVSTRQMQDVESLANRMYTKIDIPEAYRIDAKPYIERPFYAGSVKFPTTAGRYSWLDTPIKRLPGDVIRSNTALLNAMKIGSLYRSDLVLNISLAGTITHAGCILVAAIPPLNNYPNGVTGDMFLINTLLTSPHAFLYANEATSVNLAIPWYCNTDLATLNMDSSEQTMDLSSISGNYASLVFMVLNPLSPSTGSSTELTIVIEACFKNLDILIPTPRFAKWQPQAGLVKGLITTTKNGLKQITSDFIDLGANALTGFLGLHNPNDATTRERDVIISRNYHNVVDAPQQFEKLDPFANYNRIMQSPLYGSDVDEMAISHIVSKRQMLGTFQVTSSYDVGRLLWIRPISPFQGGIDSSDDSVVGANNIELMHSLHRAWRGDLKIIITSVMNNKQQCKLKLLKLYNPPKNALTQVPTYQSIANAPSHLMEFTQGGQEHSITLPYLARNELMPCSENVDYEAFAHGLYYIYLAQPLANSDGSPQIIEFNVFMEGTPSLTFYGYTMRQLYTSDFPFPTSVSDDYTIDSEESNATGESILNKRLEALRKLRDKPDENEGFHAQAGSIKVMNEPQRQKDTRDFDDKDLNAVFASRMQPNLDVRPLIRRMYIMPCDTVIVEPLSQEQNVFPLSSVLGETMPGVDRVQSPICSIADMYYGKNVGFKVAITVEEYKTTAPAPPAAQTIRVYYIPPGITLDPNNLSMLGMSTNPGCIEQNTTPTYGLYAPYQIDAVQISPHSYLYEFVIPDVTYFKYMGSPNKMAAGAIAPLATSDFGCIFLVIINNSDSRIGDTVTVRVGLTDESRMGHHAMATPYLIDKAQSPYLEASGLPPKGTLNSNLYLGGFL